MFRSSLQSKSQDDIYLFLRLVVFYYDKRQDNYRIFWTTLILAMYNIVTDLTFVCKLSDIIIRNQIATRRVSDPDLIEFGSETLVIRIWLNIFATKQFHNLVPFYFQVCTVQLFADCRVGSTLCGYKDIKKGNYLSEIGFEKIKHICFIHNILLNYSLVKELIWATQSRISFVVSPQNYRWQNRKVRFLCHRFLKVALPQWRMSLQTGDGHIEGVVCGCRRAGTTARLCRSGVRGRGGLVLLWLTQIVPNLSSLYTLFYYVIYNSVS